MRQAERLGQLLAGHAAVPVVAVDNVICQALTSDAAQRVFHPLRDVSVEVFLGDDYTLIEESPGRLVFERPAGRFQDLGYGGLASDGVTERIVIDINDKGNGKLFSLSCNAYMVENKGQGMFEDQTKVLKAFGRQYQRMLRRIKRKISKQKRR